MTRSLRTAAFAFAFAACSLSPALAQDIASNAAPTLIAEPNYLTMINVMTPNEGTSQDALAELITAGLNETSVLPGFLNATVHKSRDNDYVVVYAQWKDKASVDAAVEIISGGIGSPTHLKAFTQSTPEFHPYDVIAVVPAKSE